MCIRDRYQRRVHGHALEIDVGARELRAEVADVIRHAAQDGVGDRFLRIAAHFLVAVQLLDPLQVDGRHDADAQIDLLGDIDLLIGVGAVQAFVEHQVGRRGDLLPGRESARLLPERLRLAGVVQIFADLASAVPAVVDEQILQFFQQVGAGAEVAEVSIAGLFLRLHFGPHAEAVVAMEGVALDDLGIEALAAEDVLEALHHRAGAGPGRAGDGDDGVFDGHLFLPADVNSLPCD
eukprot:TRINITY_DN3303_c0_g1_i2.p3 TRINITY_DN3303_c0_g1~~TRINITY_DN3303_c0_g1_i2.p3  ORF type:complete len:236 (+),score=39.47 TRINITY_DN3303_c0_g1_i2:172-879(+)